MKLLITKGHLIDRLQNQNTGYFTRFEVKTEFLDNYDIHLVGGAIHEEYWIPAESLDKFNENIVGKIGIIAEFKNK